jgi:ABC-type Fe3+ transport system permease subunit
MSPQPGSWPQYWAEPPANRSGGGFARACLVIAALCSLAYAVWAFTARRGIFADFSAGRSVTIDDARTSDGIDTALLIVAGVALVGALVTWVVRRARRQASGGWDMAGLVLIVVGAVIVGLGLWLDSDVTSAATQALMGDRGAAAAVVTGAGFVVVAVGLLVCSTAVGGSRTSAARQPEPGFRGSGRPWAT